MSAGASWGWPLRGPSLPVVVRRRHELASLLRQRIAAHGRARARAAAAELIARRPAAVEVSPGMVFELSETGYAPYRRFEGHRSRKHAFDLVADMNTPESECAARIDGHDNVKRWVRNTDSETQV